MQNNIIKKDNKRGSSKKNIILLTLILCVLLVFVFILKKTEEGEKVKKQRALLAKKEASLIIDDLLIEPAQPRSDTTMRVIPVLKEKPLGVKYTFQYDWFVNGKKIPEAARSILPGKYLIKKNKVYCRVKAVQGKRESKEKKSKTIVIANSPPRIIRHPVGSFSVPGEFSYQINAIDPDGDRIEFTLLAPLGMGIELDNRTGEIRWSIPSLPKKKEATPAQYTGAEGEGSPVTPDKEEEADKTKIRIIIEVRDSEGAVTKTGILLNLEKGREVAF
jgi:hypothetical protein